MTEWRVNEAQVNADFDSLEEIRRIAWQRNPQDVLALCDRMRVQLITDEMPKRRRRLYRALIDYFDEVLEQRLADEGPEAARKHRRSVLDYVRGLLDDPDRD